MKHTAKKKPLSVSAPPHFRVLLASSTTQQITLFTASVCNRAFRCLIVNYCSRMEFTACWKCTEDSLLTSAKIMPRICLLPCGTVEGWVIYTFPVMFPTTIGESPIRTASRGLKYGDAILGRKVTPTRAGTMFINSDQCNRCDCF